jgi:hypothetical protein
MGRTTDAKKLIDSLDKNDAAANLLRRVAAASSDDDSLLALLDAFPSLLGDNGSRAKGSKR